MMTTDGIDSSSKNTSEACNPHPFSTLSSSKNSICPDGKPGDNLADKSKVTAKTNTDDITCSKNSTRPNGDKPVDKSTVRAKSHIYDNLGDIIYAGDNGFEYYGPDGKYIII